MATPVVAIERKKHLGAFYTPPDLASKLVEWGLRSPDDTVIDPSFGGLVFLRLAAERLAALGADAGDLAGQICGVDLDDDAVTLARDEGALKRCRLLHSDFFEVQPSQSMRFTANLGNPPYVRYQTWNGSSLRAHEVAAAAGVPLSRLASAWAPFIVHGCQFLEEGGRLGQVLPAELLHAQYAAPITEFLVANFEQVTVALFEQRVFPGALEEVVLLFAEGFGRGPAPGIGVVSCKKASDLRLDAVNGRGRGYFDKNVALLRLLPKPTQRLYEHLARAPGVDTLGDVASVDIGIVTGANEFFIRDRQALLDDAKGASHLPVISRAKDLEGAVVTQGDLLALGNRGRPTVLLNLSEDLVESDQAVARLVRSGEQAGLDRRYKCRIRTPWYVLPLPASPPDAFLTYMSNAHPRLAQNSVGAYSPNTIHNVRMKHGASARALAVGFYNSLTLLSAELVGRSYGGGILKLEPTEAERLLLPQLTESVGEQLGEVDRRLRGGDLQGIVELVDALVLKPLGVSDAEIAGLRRARENLAARRRGRRSRVSGEAKADIAASNGRARPAR